jgi:diacylglycerol kinase (ATP)
MAAPRTDTPAVLIMNPAAGRGLARRKTESAVRALQAAGLEFELEQTEAPEHATELARRYAAAGARLIIAAGGDGTVHEVAQGMWDTEADLGVLPLGSGNDFAQVHGIPADLEEAVRVVVAGRTGYSDVGRFGPRTFFNTLGIGFDAEASLESRRIRWLRGDPLYLLAVLRTLNRFRGMPMKIVSPGYERDASTFFIMVGIGKQEGGGFRLTPDALTDDGLFDLCVVEEIPIPSIIRLIPKAMKGTHTDQPWVRMHRAAEVSITIEQPYVLHADGQLYRPGPGKLDCTCLPRALRVRMGPV